MKLRCILCMISFFTLRSAALVPVIFKMMVGCNPSTPAGTIGIIQVPHFHLDVGGKLLVHPPSSITFSLYGSRFPSGFKRAFTTGWGLIDEGFFCLFIDGQARGQRAGCGVQRKELELGVVDSPRRSARAMVPPATLRNGLTVSSTFATQHKAVSTSLQPQGPGGDCVTV